MLNLTFDLLDFADLALIVLRDRDDEHSGHFLLFPGLRDMPTNSGTILQVPGQLASM